MERKEEIMLATLELAAENGLGSVTMSQIADKVGFKKASIYNHFKSKDQIIKEMYEYIRARAKSTVNPSGTDYGEMVKGQSPESLIQHIVNNYRRMNGGSEMAKLYKVVYSERPFSPEAASIMKDEAERMLLATKRLFYAMQVHGKLKFDNIDMASLSFTMAIHDIMEYDMDCRVSSDNKKNADKMIEEYINWFCGHYRDEGERL